MVINIVLAVIGLISLLFGVKNKLKLWMVVGVILLTAGVISGMIDYKMSEAGIDGGRVPMVIENTMH